MLPEQRRVSQMTTILRLRAMQSDKVSQLYARAAFELASAKEKLDRDQRSYLSSTEHNRKQRESGLFLNPALHEIQLQDLLALKKTLTERQEHVRRAEAELVKAKVELNDSRVDKHIAENALASAKQALNQYWLVRESIDATDGQLAKDGRNGI